MSQSITATSTDTPLVDDSRARIQRLETIAESLLERARKAGASQAEVACSEEQGLSVNVRMGAVDTVEATHDRGISVTVYFGQRKGSASTADLRETSLDATVAQACAIAKHTEADAAAGLADPERMAQAPGEFDTWHPWDVQADAAIDMALACEAAGRELDSRISNADGTQVGSGHSLSVYANSHGFVGAERHTMHSMSCALIAGTGEAMQRDGWYTLALESGALEAPREVGRKAAERALSRLDARGLPTGQMPVLFSAEVARSLIGHFLSAISGGALYRKASFLLDSVGQPVFPEWLSIHEHPHLQRGLRSTAFDAEGVATVDAPLVSAGVLAHYLLGSYSARKLGLASTGNAGGVHNLHVAGRGGTLDELVSEMGDGLLVTELMGQGVNPVTGDYSRGAAGFRVEGGRITHAVDGITIAGNLRRMFADIRAVGDDIDARSHIACGSLLVGGMTVAGE